MLPYWYEQLKKLNERNKKNNPKNGRRLEYSDTYHCFYIDTQGIYSLNDVGNYLDKYTRNHISNLSLLLNKHLMLDTRVSIFYFDIEKYIIKKVSADTFKKVVAQAVLEGSLIKYDFIGYCLLSSFIVGTQRCVRFFYSPRLYCRRYT